MKIEIDLRVTSYDDPSIRRAVDKFLAISDVGDLQEHDFIVYGGFQTAIPRTLAKWRRGHLFIQIPNAITNFAQAYICRLFEERLMGMRPAWLHEVRDMTPAGIAEEIMTRALTQTLDEDLCHFLQLSPVTLAADGYQAAGSTKKPSRTKAGKSASRVPTAPR